MAPKGGHRRSRQPKPSSIDEGAAFLRHYGIQMIDKGEGHAVDWPVLASMLFKAAFGVLDEAKGDPGHDKVLRKVEVSLYDRLAHNGDDGLPDPVKVDAAPIVSGVKPSPLPQARNRP